MRHLIHWFICFILAGIPGLAAAEISSQQVGIPNGDLIGSIGIHEVVAGETLLDIAVSHRLGYVELRLANPEVDPWLPKVGELILLPTRRLLPPGSKKGIMINLAERRLYHFTPNGSVGVYPVGIGDRETVTPVGRTGVIEKRKKPIWFPPPSIRLQHPELPTRVPPGPENPLGPFALELGWPSYLIHGTNSPFSIGRAGTHGCIRLYNPDIETLFEAVRIGTPVLVMNERFKVGISEGRVYLEVHPDNAVVEKIEAESDWTDLAGDPNTTNDVESAIRDALISIAPEASINWFSVEMAIQRRQGFATVVSDTNRGNPTEKNGPTETNGR